MLQELYFAARRLLKYPGFTFIAVITLALGIGSTSAVFSLIQGVLLTPPPYRQPDRLVLVSGATADGQQIAHASGWAPLQWMEWQEKAKSLDGLAAYGWTFNFLTRSDGSESIEGMWVTKDYFRITGLQPLMGRVFLDSETGLDAKPVIILGYDLWKRAFQGDPAIVGKSLRISRFRSSPVVIGVMPPGIRFLPSPSASQEPNYNRDALVDFWLPAAPNAERMKDAEWNVLGRLQNGATAKQVQAELTVLAAREAQTEHNFAGVIPKVQLLSTELNRDGERILLPLLGAAVLVLLIACGNAASLLLVRGLQRQREYAVRTALGIRSAALFYQACSESLLVALGGGALGVALAFGLVRLVKLISGHAIPRLDSVSTGWPILACSLGAAILSAALAGLFPGLRALRIDPAEALKSAGPKSSVSLGERRLLRGVTMLQTALTLALLVGAGLLIRTMNNVAKIPSGYGFSHILTMSVTAVQGDWASFHRHALQRVSALPGVQYAAFAWGVPLTGNNWPDPVEVEGQPPPSKASDRVMLPLRAVTEDYFKLMNLAILDGRDFRSTDNGPAGVAVVNRAFADRYFPKQTTIGKKLWLFGRDKPSTQVIGIVRNARTDDLTHAPEPEIYLSLWQASAFSKHLVVRTAADPRAVAPQIRRELRSVDPTVAVENVKTLGEIRDASLAERTFAMQLLVGFSIVGSTLTLVGIYGVLSLSIASRRREIAIRTAVGAEWKDIRNLVFGEGLRLIGGGVVAGIAAALLLSGVLRSFLFQVAPTDPTTLAVVVVLFVAVSLIACWEPTRRAAKVDPAEALRCD